MMESFTKMHATRIRQERKKILCLLIMDLRKIEYGNQNQCVKQDKNYV